MPAGPSRLTDGPDPHRRASLSSPRPAPRRPAQKHWLSLAVILVLAGVLIAAVLTQGTSSSDTAATPATAEPSPYDGPATGVVGADEIELDMARRDPGDPLTTGALDAPVVMVVYSDYQCPFCAVWSHRTLPALASFIDAGELRVEWRDVNVFGEDSERAARAAYAAGLQDRFLDYHHALFADGDRPPAELLTDTGLVGLAETLGLDTDRFAADLTSAEVAAAVRANEEEGAQIGAFSTPSFLVAGAPIVGAQPSEIFVEAVEAALEQASR